MCRMLTYFKIIHNSELVIDPSDPKMDANGFDRRDWMPSEFGNESKEGVELTCSMRHHIGIIFLTRAKVDAYRVSNAVTRRY